MHNTKHNQDPRHQSSSGALEDPGIPEDSWVSVHLDQPSIHLSKSEQLSLSPLDSYIISDRFRCFPDGKPIPST